MQRRKAGSVFENQTVQPTTLQGEEGKPRDHHNLCRKLQSGISDKIQYMFMIKTNIILE